MSGVLAACAEAVGESPGNAHKPRADRFGRHIEHAPRIDGIEALAVNEQQGQALRRWQALEKCGGDGIECRPLRAAEQSREACIARSRLAGCAGVIAALLE